MKDTARKPKVSVIILTWNAERFVDTCLESLSIQSFRDFEVIVVDNASTDETVRAIKESPWKDVVSKLIVNRKNLGCAGGNNAGFRESGGEFVIILNPDTVVEKDWLQEIVKALEEDPEAAVAGSKIYYPNSNVIQHAGGILHPNGMTNHYGNGEEDVGKYDVLRDVDYVTGAALAVRREFLESLGGFDEDYFPAYFEETDLCYKAHQAGHKVLYVPASTLYHFESPSLTVFSEKFFALYYKMRFRFIVKNYSLWKILTVFLPFELKWMWREPAAKGFRLRQLLTYWQGLKFLITRKR